MRRFAPSLWLVVAMLASTCGTNESCDDSSECDDGLVCNVALHPPRCVEPGGEGDPCVGNRGLCAQGYACECKWSCGEGAQTCRELPGLGEPCLETEPAFKCFFATCGCGHDCAGTLACDTSLGFNGICVGPGVVVAGPADVH
jgi:hypothetical protein